MEKNKNTSAWAELLTEEFADYWLKNENPEIVTVPLSSAAYSLKQHMRNFLGL